MWWLAAILSAGAGSIHVALGLAHANGPLPHQAFFLTVGALQIGWASMAWPDGPSELLYRGAIALNVLVLSVYGISRVVGIPPGEVFEAGRADIIAAGFEVALLLILIRRRATELGSVHTLAATIIVLTLMIIGVVAGFEGEGHFSPTGIHVH